MSTDTSIPLVEHFDKLMLNKIEPARFQSISEAARVGLLKQETDETRLQLLRLKLQAGEDSPVVEGFDGEGFIVAMHKKYAK